jgi:hypothetical protein
LRTTCSGECLFLVVIVIEPSGPLILDNQAAERVPHTPTWTVEPLGPRTVLVQLHDLDAWFGAQHPDQHTLDTAAQTSTTCSHPKTHCDPNRIEKIRASRTDAG